MDNSRKILKSVFHFATGTLLSRSVGFIREIALSSWFGATPDIAAFFVAYRCSQIIRRLFGETTLLSSFSPYFEEIRSHFPQKEKEFFRDFLCSWMLLFLLVIVGVEAILFLFWHFYFPSSELLFLTIIMFPGAFFIVLYALSSGLLQSLSNYSIPSIAPVMFNIFFLVAIWWAKKSSVSVVVLAIGVVVALFMQWLFVLPSTLRWLRGIRWNNINLFNPELRRMILSFCYTVIGVGAVQVNTLFDSFFALGADLSGPAYLYYAMRIYQLPMALFGLSFASVMLPSLSRAVQVQDESQYKALIRFASIRIVAFILPTVLSMSIFGDHLVNFVYGRAAFNGAAVAETALCLWGYILGLLPAVFSLLFASAHYAQKNFSTPLYGSLISIGANIFFNMLFVYWMKWGAFSIALATSLSAYLHCFYLGSSLKVGRFMNKLFYITCLKIGAATSLAALATYWVRSWFERNYWGNLLLSSFAEKLIQLLLLGSSFILFFVLAVSLFRIQGFYWKWGKEMELVNET